MGRFYLYHGEVRPSDSYLASHHLPDLEPDDWYHDDYGVEDDDEVYFAPRICDRCGCSFTLSEAMSVFSDRIDWPPYGEEFVGEYCGDCAAEIYNEKY